MRVMFMLTRMRLEVSVFHEDYPSTMSCLRMGRSRSSFLSAFPFSRMSLTWSSRMMPSPLSALASSARSVDVGVSKIFVYFGRQL